MDVVYFEANSICDFFNLRNIDDVEMVFSDKYLLRITKKSFSLLNQEINSCIVFDFESDSVLIEKHFLDKEMFIMEIISKIREKFITRKTGEIYRIVNKLNNHCYVGMTSGTSYLRWKTHISGYEKSAISKAIAEYGINNFYFEVLEEIEVCLDGAEDSKSALLKAERKWIHHFNSINEGYNARI